MSAIEKEKIFVELRRYHTSEFPEKLPSQELTALRSEFGLIEDRVVAMLLRFVNGKSVFVDFSEELDSFQDKVKLAPSGEQRTEENKQLFFSKTRHLSEIIGIAKVSNFKLKTPRPTRVDWQTKVGG